MLAAKIASTPMRQKKADITQMRAIGCRISGLDYASPESRVAGRLNVSVLAEDCVGAF
jgi:hypothetical protein